MAMLIALAWSGVATADPGFGISARQPRPMTFPDRMASSAAVPLESVKPLAPSSLHSDRQTRETFQEKTAERLLPHPAITRIVAFESTGQLYGSGTYVGSVGQYGLIVSNWHVVSGTETLVHVHFPTGFASFGHVLVTDRKWDLAVIVISRPPVAIAPLAIARDVPRPGDSLWIAGYGAGTFRVAGGRCQRYLAPEIPIEGQPQYEYVELSVDARQGDSGGPILNQHGEVAGVLFGSDSRNTAGSHCGRVRVFLEQASRMLDKLPLQPEVLFASIEQTGPKHPLSMTSFPIKVEATPATSASDAASSVSVARPSSSFGIVSIAQRHDPATAPLTPPPGIVQTTSELTAIP